MKCNFCDKEIKEQLSFKNMFSKKESIKLCDRCRENISINKIRIENYTLYYFCNYKFIKEIIYNIKYFGDISQGIKFKSLFKEFLRLYKFDIITIVPSNITREAIRGYNHIELICEFCGVEYKKLLTCSYREKQAKLHKKRMENNFKLLGDVIGENNKKILIVDDVFTSGNTLKNCAKQLENKFKNCEISFLTLAFTEDKK
ncbi:ComF family protein [Gemella bergeri]